MNRGSISDVLSKLEPGTESFMKSCKSCGRTVEPYFIEGNKCGHCTGSILRRRREFAERMKREMWGFWIRLLLVAAVFVWLVCSYHDEITVALYMMSNQPLPGK